MNKSYLFKGVTLVLSAVAIIALISSGCKKTSAAENGSVAKSNGIVFVELDSVIAHFDMAKDKQNELMEKQKNSEAELTNKSQSFQRDYQDYMTKSQKGLITRATASEMEQNLQQQQQNLLNLRDQLASTLNEESSVAQRQILEYIDKYLVEYNKLHNYQYILAKQFPGQVLFADKSFDITTAVTDGLNAKYKSEKK
jgi:outer membrane protein